MIAWLLGAVAIGLIVGTGSAGFLTLLDVATMYRGENPSIVFTLPVAGLLIGLFYERFGAPVAAGTALVIDRVVGEGGPIPARMAPMVVIGTVLTHLFGGSAGREGTAVQMGASLADALCLRLPAGSALRQQLVTAGVAAGFGSVFGTPVAGAVFALEWSVIGQLRYVAVVPAVVAAVVGDLTTTAWGVGHTHYAHPEALALDPLLLAKWALFAAAIAAVTSTFVELTARLKSLSKHYLVRLPWRMFVGGVVVVALWQISGTDIYLGLGVPTIERAFADPALPLYVCFAKLVFTSVTLASGYLGGEVTPLFFVGATLGSALAPWLGLPPAMAAGVGMAAVFACASNAPLALSLMCVELLGVNVLPHVVIVAVLAYFLTGGRGIYPNQRRLLSDEGGTLRLREPDA